MAVVAIVGSTEKLKLALVAAIDFEKLIIILNFD